ncbi:MAG TPA: hypothetical protein VMR44_04965 [Thermoanaerobaculia bacterium]|nr:hypothetical protein [Thermoanaerobaculia bacterium]
MAVVARLLVALALGATALLAACTQAPAPGDPALAPPAVPVVFVPGVTGSILRDRESGEVVWGSGRNLIAPRDGGYALAFPVAPPLGWEPRLEAGGVLEEIRLGPVRQPVYGPLLEALEAHGYRRGDLAAPRPGETLFGFAYDWRRSNVDTARDLLARLEALRRARGEDRLYVDLVCQSNGTHVCRYLVRHGGRSLDEAEAGAGPPGSIAVRNLVLVAGSSGGALRILRELDRGRRYLPAPVGRRMLQEVLFTFRALFEDLPHDPGGRFLDPHGRPLEVDLYDPGAWIERGWSVFAPLAARRLAAAGRDDLFGTAEERRVYLARALADSRRLQRLLARDPEGFVPPCPHLLGDGYLPTPERAVLERVAPGWRTLYSGDRRVERSSYLRALASAPGDGHATLASQLTLSPRERAALAGEPFLIQGGHFELILDPAIHRRVFEALQTPSC